MIIHMKDNAKPLYDKWESIYWNELEKLKKENNNPNFHEGWCIIEDEKFIHSLEDVVGLYIFGEDDNALGWIDEEIEMRGENDTIFGYKLVDIQHEMEKYFEY